MVLFVQFQKRINHLWRSVTLSVQLFHWCLSRFLNCIISTKSRKGSHIFYKYLFNVTNNIKTWFMSIFWKRYDFGISSAKRLSQYELIRRQYKTCSRRKSLTNLDLLNFLMSARKKYQAIPLKERNFGVDLFLRIIFLIFCVDLISRIGYRWNFHEDIISRKSRKFVS